MLIRINIGHKVLSISEGKIFQYGQRIALITLGEGWHNNHRRYPGSERQGFYWWEIDISHYVLVLLSKLGIVWNLRTPPQRIYDEAARLQ